MPHECNIYCDGDVHAHRMLRRQPNDETFIRQDYEGAGYEVVHIRPAPECDVEVWRRQMSHHIETVNGVAQHAPLRAADQRVQQMQYPYLVWMRRRTTQTAALGGNEKTEEDR